MKGFKVVNYISFPLPKLLGANDVTAVSKKSAQLQEVVPPVGHRRA